MHTVCRAALFLLIALGVCLASPASAQRRADGYGQVILCESHDYRQFYCAADTRGGIEIVNQLSATACVEGRNWGWDQRGVWVSNGCRAEFAVGGGRGYRDGGNAYHGNGSVVRCESHDYAQVYCEIDTRGGVRLFSQLSSAACVEGDTWGADRRGIWVRQGCRAEFELGGYGRRGAGLPLDRPRDDRQRNVFCESQDRRYRHCPARIQRQVELVRQMSDADCVFNRSWGFDVNGIWVDRGCRGEFAIY